MAGVYRQVGTNPQGLSSTSDSMNYATTVLEQLSRPGMSLTQQMGQMGVRMNEGVTDSPRSSLKAFPQGALSENTTATSGQTGQAGFERRVAWLEEDVAVLHRRLRDECGDGVAGVGGAAGDSGLRALVARLDGELSAERRAREQLEARMINLEEAIRHERKEREAQLRGFSTELETTMRGLIGRIDEGLSAGAAAMRERTDATEARLRSLIRRVDEGLSAGAAALQDTLSATGALTVLNEMQEQSGGIPGLQQLMAQTAPGVRPDEVAFMGEQAPVENIQSYEQLRQENLRLREQRAQINGPRPAYANVVSNTPGLTPQASPSLAMPQTVQVPGSGLAPAGAQMPRNVGYRTAGAAQPQMYAGR
mmetsp:Transcript_23296/g.42696  ORF Transcript_23296/g.42696 Transcript_23296/m.42696 type:complete len:365 (+) Transcript_23296:1-1095(+)